jgi:hypothetical protein
MEALYILLKNNGNYNEFLVRKPITACRMIGIKPILKKIE